MDQGDKHEKERRERIKRILDAKIEALWQLGEPKEKPKMRVTGPIPAISDIEYDTAATAIEAIAEKYGIGKHDLYMLRRAHIIAIYHALGSGCPIRIELSEGIASQIKWQ